MHFKNGNTQKKIAEIVDLPTSTVQHIIERYVREHRVHDKGRPAPNKIHSDRDVKWIVRQVKINPSLSAPTLADHSEKYLGKRCHPETIRRVLRDADFNGRTARNKPYISAKNRKCRLQFATDHINKSEAFWRTVIFADESKFNLFGSDGKTYVWRKANTELEPRNLRGPVKHVGGSVKVWGCMSANGVGNLAFIDGNMDKHMYLSLLQQNLKQSAEKLNIKDDFRLYQDNDQKHKSSLVQTWLIWNCPHIVQTPPQSPDLNVIENLWSVLEKNIRKHDIHNKHDVKKALQEEWNNITPEYTKTLVESMPRRLKAVSEQKGYPTKY